MCEARFSDFVRRVHDAKGCAGASLCSFVKGRTPVFEYCSAGYYVNAGHPFFDDGSGSSQAEQAETALQGCFQPGSTGGCTGIPDPPVCWQGKCYARPQGAGLESCFGQSDGSECSKCLCASCTSVVSSCLADPGCRELYPCVKQSGALGRYVSSLPLGPGGPCASLVDKAGGPSSASAKLLQKLVACHHSVACFALCGTAK